MKLTKFMRGLRGVDYCMEQLTNYMDEWTRTKGMCKIMMCQKVVI